MARAEREELERLAEFSSRHAEELRRLQAAEAAAGHDREILEWAARISTEAADKLRALQRKEAEEREAWRRAEQFAETLLEGNWDPSQHPRAPKGQPDGGQWVGQGGGAGAGGGSDAAEAAAMRIAATTASHTTSKGIPVHFACSAIEQGATIGCRRRCLAGFESKMTTALAISSRPAPSRLMLYDHAFDTWNGVTHDKYSGAMRELLDEWIKTCGGKLDEDGARKFLSWIATGSCGDASFAAKHKKLFDKGLQMAQGLSAKHRGRTCGGRDQSKTDAGRAQGYRSADRQWGANEATFEGRREGRASVLLQAASPCSRRWRRRSFLG